MAPTSENIHSMAPEGPFEMFLSTSDLDNSCETYFYCDYSPPIKSVIPEASPAFRRALGTMDSNGRYNLYQTDSDCSDNEGDDTNITDPKSQISDVGPKRSTSLSSGSASSSPLSLSPESSPLSSPRLSPQQCRSSPRPIHANGTRSPRKTTSPKTSSKFLSVPSSSLPTDLSTRCKTADSSDSGAHNTLAGVALRKGCTRKAASFGGYDAVKVDSHRFEKRVTWADERGSKHQLINVRLIRPRLAMGTSDGRSSTPGQSILKTPEMDSSKE